MKISIGSVVMMSQGSGLIGFGNPQCVSSVNEALGEISLYGHNQHYKLRDVREVIKAANSISDAIITLTAAVKDDSEYAWGWHCNLAVAAQDSGMDHAESQVMARRFMGWAFQCSDYPDLNSSEGSNVGRGSTGAPNA